MSVIELVKKLEIESPGGYENGDFVIDLESSNQFNKLLNKIDKDDEFEEQDSSISFEESFINFVYNNEIEVTLKARFIDDEYSVLFREMSDENGKDN